MAISGNFIVIRKTTIMQSKTFFLKYAIIFFVVILTSSYSLDVSPKSFTNLNSDTTKLITINFGLRDSLKSHIRSFPNKRYSNYQTPIDFRFYINDFQTDSIIEDSFQTASWYSIYKDTIDLVAHVGDCETAALLLHFVKDKLTVYYYRASHERQKYFRLNEKDSFAGSLEIPAIRYKLQLSEVPDSITKPVVYGFIDMTSDYYYDKRDTLQKKTNVSGKFYFCSQYRNFN